MGGGPEMYENSVTFSGAFFKFSVPLLDLVFFLVRPIAFQDCNGHEQKAAAICGRAWASEHTLVVQNARWQGAHLDFRKTSAAGEETGFTKASLADENIPM